MSDGGGYEQYGQHAGYGQEDAMQYRQVEGQYAQHDDENESHSHHHESHHDGNGNNMKQDHHHDEGEDDTRTPGMFVFCD